MASCRSPLSARPWASRRGDCSGIAPLAPARPCPRRGRGHGGYCQAHGSVAARLPRRPRRARPAISAGRPAGIGLPLAGSAPVGAPCGRVGGGSRTGQKSALRRRRGAGCGRGRLPGRGRPCAPCGACAPRGGAKVATFRGSRRPRGVWRAAARARAVPEGRLWPKMRPRIASGGGGATPFRGATKKALY